MVANTDDLTSLTRLYKDLHAHPELAFEEHRTAAIVAERMTALGLQVIEGIGGTGVAAVLANGPGPTVWLRADMDGLPVHELTGLDYASTAIATTADGLETPVMHACGHDMHVTWLIGAMEHLAAHRDEFSGTIVAVFQPAEEVIAGAAAMVDDGLLTKVPHPDIVLGQHIGPLPAGVVSLTSGAMMAASDDISVVMHGRGGHGSTPQRTIDPVLAAASTVVRLQSVVSREVTPGELAVVTVGKLQAGTKSNIIPADASLGVNVRSVDASTRERVLAAVERIVRAEAAASGMTTEPDVTLLASAPATMNDPDATERLRSRFVDAFGDRAVIDYGTVSGSEDVSVLSSSAGVPLVYWFTGGADPVAFAAASAAGRAESDIPSNHSPYFAPVIEPTLQHGIDALVVAARTFLESPAG
ncbi:hippurate hydrolase [Agreia bicolorata]|uniref:Hippurate hydrolase n=1 Tax=Agreia bicolorata TaxID=110935 RepID=A0A1T4Y745_9MICO|nr:amidohydrolase [Agreia bicolorata]SKA97609.1 hippurate hydrolase [Agreia bicolorata]